MYDELTPTDIKKMEDEIEYRKLVSTSRHWRREGSQSPAISVGNLNTMH